jgi:hypothetical protein
MQRASTNEGMIIMTATLTTAEIAEMLETTPRELRKFLRKDEVSGIGRVGKGARYALPASKREINALAKKFAKWVESQESAKNAESDNEVDDDNATD